MKKVKIALLGLGTVGSGVWKILKANSKEILEKSGCEIEIAKILVRNIDKKRAVEVPKDILTTDFNEIIYDDSINIVVEVIGGVSPAKEYILNSISRKKHIVTANKMLLATHGEEIFQEAKKNGVNVYYEASVAGGIPIINSIKESLTANKIEEMYGIVNGTTNYILTKMQFENMTFEDALKEAQEKGYAEADMTSDIDAYDAQYKLAILSSLAFGNKVKINDIYREGIASVTVEDMTHAKELGYAIKLLAIAKKEGDTLELRVHPTMIPQTHPLANVYSSFNSVFVKGNAVGELMFYGRGAGDLPTGSAVVSDIIAILRKEEEKKVATMPIINHKREIKRMEDVETVFYIKIKLNNDCQAMGKILTTLENNNINLKSFNQIVNENGDFELSFITNKSIEKNVVKSLEILKDISVIQSVDSLIRVENLSC